MSEQIIIILNRPQKLVNIGGTVRAMKNMGLRRLRMVSAVAYEPHEITALAHRAEDILAATQYFDSLDAALADLHYVVGTSARRRSIGTSHSPRELAPEILKQAAAGPIGILFGPEDNGLIAAELDRCHTSMTIPTDPDYASLNLAQAVLLVAYELRMAAATELPAGSSQPLAQTAQLEELFTAAQQSLTTIEFFKSGQSMAIMRTLRSLAHRAQPSSDEAALLTAICREVVNFLRRRGHI